MGSGAFQRVVWCDVGWRGAPGFFFSLKTAVALWGLWESHINFRNVCSSFVENAVGILLGIVDCIGQYGHFNNVILSVPGQSICFHLLGSSSVSFFAVL